MLRTVALQQWGGSRDEHLAAMAEVGRALTGAGLTDNARRKQVRVTVMERQDDNAYETCM